MDKQPLRLVRLRTLTDADVPKLIEWRNDLGVTTHLARATMSSEEVKDWFGTLTHENGNHPYAIEVDGQLVGYGVIDGVDNTNRKCDVGLVLGEKSCWGKGICKEVARQLVDIAFDELNMHRICAIASERNLASINCFQGVGFQEEGRLRDGYHRDGKFYDLVLLSILENERKS